jgi:hypothetical protein
MTLDMAKQGSGHDAAKFLCIDSPDGTRHRIELWNHGVLSTGDPFISIWVADDLGKVRLLHDLLHEIRDS